MMCGINYILWWNRGIITLMEEFSRTDNAGPALITVEALCAAIRELEERDRL